MNEFLVSEQERMEMPFFEVGEQIKIKVVNLNKAAELMLEGRSKSKLTNRISLKVIKPDPFKEINKHIVWTKDPMTDIYYGINSGFLPDGNIRWQRILLRDINDFNLARPGDAKTWVVLRMHPCILGCPLESVTDPIFEVHDPEIEAKKINQKARLIALALQRANKMKVEDLVTFARWMGIPIPFEVTKTIVRSQIADFAMMQPDIFNARYDDPLRAIFESISTGMALNIIKHNIKTGYSFEEIALGHTDAEMARMLELDGTLLVRIQRANNELDTQAHEILSKAEA